MWGEMMGIPYGGFFLLLVGIAIVCFIFIISRGLSNREQEVSALDLLKKRYALGEIDKATYDSMKSVITEEGK